MIETALSKATAGFHPLAVLRWALRLARPFVHLDGRQAAAWDLVQAVADSTDAPRTD